MRLSTSALFSTALVLFSRVIFAQTSSALTLSTFQQINGFSPVCTQAYNTPLTDCSSSDFSGHGCSAKCIGFLDDLTNLLNTACAGTSSYPNTLIALFFSGEGTQTLCSNAGEKSSSSGGAVVYGQEGGQDGASTTQTAATEESTSTTSISTTSTTSISTTSTTSISTISTTSISTIPTTSSSSTLQAAATSSTTTVVPTTVTPPATTTSVSIVGTTVTPESSSDASTSSSHTKSSTSSASTSTSTSNGNGGGTPLDIGSSACHDAAVTGWLLALIAGSAGVAWLL